MKTFNEIHDDLVKLDDLAKKLFYLADSHDRESLEQQTELEIRYFDLFMEIKQYMRNRTISPSDLVESRCENEEQYFHALNAVLRMIQTKKLLAIYKFYGLINE